MTVNKEKDTANGERKKGSDNFDGVNLKGDFTFSGEGGKNAASTANSEGKRKVRPEKARHIVEGSLSLRGRQKKDWRPASAPRRAGYQGRAGTPARSCLESMLFNGGKGEESTILLPSKWPKTVGGNHLGLREQRVPCSFCKGRLFSA